MEIKLSNIVHSIEANIRSAISETVSVLGTQLGTVKEDIAQVQSAIASLASDLKAMVSDLQDEIKACRPVESSVSNQPCATAQPDQLSAPPPPLSLQLPSLELAPLPVTTSPNFVSVYHFIQEPRTTCSSTFAITDAMKRVDSQFPCRVEGGWPVPLIKDKRFKKR
ncbi:hypothetical protein GGI09_009080 [Coemansia sp. S100]|nr:hypothetical protein GGI09_009080 [Coemansia sp. S100]